MGSVGYKIGLERDKDGGGGITYSWKPVKSIKKSWPSIEERKEEKSFIEIIDRKDAELNGALLQLNRKSLEG